MSQTQVVEGERRRRRRRQQQEQEQAELGREEIETDFWELRPPQ